MKKISIVGAGLVGTYLSIHLAQFGYAVEIFEKRSDPRLETIMTARSINLALSKRGISALEKINLQNKILAEAVPLYGRYVHETTDHIQRYDITNQTGIYSISRQYLNHLLLETAEKTSIKFNFSHRLVDLDADQNTLQFQDELTKKTISHDYDILIACDGAFSSARSLLKKQNHLDLCQKMLSHGYKELSIDPNHGKLLAKNYLHIWPRKQFMLIALPNYDGSFTCTLFLALEGQNSFINLVNEVEIQQFFQQYFPDVLTLIPDITKQFKMHPIGQLNSITCFPWHYRHTLLIGDAAHAMSPFFGQGMNCSLEDCAILMDLLQKNNDAWETTFSQFSQQRKVDTDIITLMSYDNYREMRDDVTQLKFQLQKELEKILMEKYPTIFLAKYNMVTFTTMPYHQIQYLAEIQQVFFNDVLAGVESIQDINWRQIEAFIAKYQLILQSI